MSSKLFHTTTNFPPKCKINQREDINNFLLNLREQKTEFRKLTEEIHHTLILPPEVKK